MNNYYLNYLPSELINIILTYVDRFPSVLKGFDFPFNTFSYIDIEKYLNHSNFYVLHENLKDLENIKDCTKKNSNIDIPIWCCVFEKLPLIYIENIKDIVEEIRTKYNHKTYNDKIINFFGPYSEKLYNYFSKSQVYIVFSSNIYNYFGYIRFNYRILVNTEYSKIIYTIRGHIDINTKNFINIINKN